MPVLRREVEMGHDDVDSSLAYVEGCPCLVPDTESSATSTLSYF